MPLVIDEDATLAAVWLLATLNGDTNHNIRVRSSNNYASRSIKNKKSVDKIDIVKTCNSIINVSNRVSLRSISNLMFGTVLAYKSKCLQNWKDVNSCRILIQRLNKVINSGGSKTVVDFTTNFEDKSKIVLFQDDPGFDISHGLVVEYDGGRDEPHEADWTVTVGFDKVDEDDDDTEESGYYTATQNTQNEKWEDLEFGFNADGEVVEKDAVKEINDEQPADEEIQLSLLEGINDDNGGALFADAFDNELNVVEEVTEPQQDEVIEDVTPRKRKAGGADKRHSKRLIVDNEVCLSVACIKMIRDGYVSHESDQRVKFIGGVKYSVQSMIIERFSDIGKHYRNEFSNLRVTIPEEVFDDYGPPGMDMDIEYGRERQHSRSSSVSSIEEARRATSRHSSSFYFDFNNENNNERYNDDMDVNMDVDMAQMDISLVKPLSVLDDEIHGTSEEEVNMASVEEFYDEIAASHKRVFFSDLAPATVCTKREASVRFMHVLELATWRRVRAVQQSARGEIRVGVVDRVDVE